MIKKNLIKLASTALIGTFILTGCGAGSSIVAKVNGDDISVEEYGKDYNIIKQRYEAQYGPDFLAQQGPEGKTMEQVLKQNVLDKLIIEKVIMQKAEEDKILATDKEVDEEIASYKEMVGGEEEFNKFLEANGMEADDFKDGIKKEITVEKYKEKYLESLKLEDKDLKEYYEKNKDRYETIKASHILVEKEDEAKAISEELKNGADFGELSKKSIEPEAAERKGDLGFFGRGQMVPEFEEAAFALEVNEISDPVKTEHGYHVIKVTEKKESFDQVKEDVKKDIENEKFEEKLQSLQKEADVKTYMENIEKIDSDKKEETSEKAEPVQPKTEQPATKEKKEVEVKESPEAEIEAKDENKVIEEEKAE